MKQPDMQALDRAVRLALVCLAIAILAIFASAALAQTSIRPGVGGIVTIERPHQPPVTCFPQLGGGVVCH